MNALTPISTNALIPTDMRSALDLAQMMSQGRLVPAHLQDKPGDCLMVIEQAMRWSMSPFAVAQETSVIQGKMMFSGKLVAAAVHSSGLLVGRLAYVFEGAGDARAVIVSGTIRGERAARQMRVTLRDARTPNKLWTIQPDQQLVYFSTRAWARRHAPEVMLGVYSPEEMDQPAEVFDGPTIEAKPEPARVEQRREPTPTEQHRDAQREALSQPTRQEAPREAPREKAAWGRNPQDQAWMDGILASLQAATTAAAVLAVGDLPAVRGALTRAPIDIREELTAALADAYDRVQEREIDAAETAETAEGDGWPGPKYDAEIPGEKYAAA